MPRIADVLVDRPRILFVGINPGLRSAELGHHFSGPGNPFWRLLHAAGLVPTAMTWEQDRELVRHGLALTNLCPRPTRSAADLTAAELERGARTVARKVARLRPEVVAFVGLTVYQRCVRVAREGGPGPKAAPFAGARAFVLPNPSGLNASYPGFAPKLRWFRALAGYAGAPTPQETAIPAARGRTASRARPARGRGSDARGRAPGSPARRAASRRTRRGT